MASANVPSDDAAMSAGGAVSTPTAAESVLAQFNSSLATCEKLVPIIGELYRKNVIVSVCKESLASRSPVEILRAHEFAARHFDSAVCPADTLAIVTALASIGDILPWRFDAGFARVRFETALGSGGSDGCMSPGAQAALADQLRSELAEAEGRAERGHGIESPTDVVLFGHGRIGRLLNRLLVEKAGAGGKLVLRAIVVRLKASSIAQDLEKRAALLKKDSVHGEFPGTVSIDVERSAIIANGTFIRVIYAGKPEEVDYTAYGITNAIVIDNTGAFRTRAALERHVACPGARFAVLTAPASGGGVPTIVAGVNFDRISDADTVYSAASCTTNAIVPLLRLLEDTCGVESGHIESVHSYTNDQNLVDGFHKKSRRGRAAALNMVPTETGAAKAVALAVPELAGRLTASAIRVPTPNVSMALLIIRPRVSVTADTLMRTLKAASIAGPLHNQLDFSEDADAVSSDHVGARAACIIDWPACIISPDRLVLKAWYDNEAGYSAQVIRLVQRLAGVVFPEYPDSVPDAMLSPAMKPVGIRSAMPPPPALDAGQSAMEASAAASSATA